MKSLARISVLALALGALPLQGCWIWDSITSPSDSISGSFDAISGSFKAMSDVISKSSGSSGDDTSEKKAYREDLRAYAAAFVKTGGTQEDFLRGIGRVAELHGVTHWESEPSTPMAIGAGLRDAGVSEARLQRQLLGADPSVASLVREGWERAGS